MSTVSNHNSNHNSNHKKMTRAIIPPPVEASGAKAYLQQVSEVLKRLPFAQIDQVVDRLWKAYRDDQAVYLFGNGGSAALASHCACDLGKGTIMNGNRRFRVLALTDNVPLLTAWANDACYADVFAEQLRSFLRKDDVVFALSASGNSPNVLNALSLAQEVGASTMGLTGFQGGKMKALCELSVVIPSENMQVIEDIHLSVTHSIFTSLRARIVEMTSQRVLAVAASSRSSS
jgi:D-sedoheptulose 7-phosphate isomerase